MDNYHQPVLLQQVCTLLDVKPGSHYIDATLGGGGHALEILKRGGKVLGIDQDPDALSACPGSEGLVKVQANFTHLEEIAKSNSWQPVYGILFDLGVSSHQITKESRGFSFQKDGPLDMRMDPTLPITAGFLVNELSPKDLAKIIKDFGEEPRAAAISQKIVSARPLKTTFELAGLIPDKNQCRRVFQALRIAVNDELGAIQSVLPQSLSLLAPGGKVLVISFHSLEDRIVKNQFLLWSQKNLGQIITPKPVTPNEDELSQNRKSQSAKLRVFQKNYV